MPGWIFKLLGPLVIIAIIGGLWYNRNSWKETAENETAFINEIIATTQVAVGIKSKAKITRDNVKTQISNLGDSNKKLKNKIDSQNKTITEMTNEAIKLRASKKELQALYDKAKAQRAAATKLISKLENEPTKYKDGVMLIEDAERALDELRRNGVI